MRKTLLFLAILSMFASCQESKENNIIEGQWKVELKLDSLGNNLPFIMEFVQLEKELVAVVINGEEKIFFPNVKFDEDTDSIEIESPVFHSAFKGVKSKNIIEGAWFDYSRKGDYQIPFIAKYGLDQRFSFDHHLVGEIQPKWETHFGSEEDEWAAIGLFKTNDNNQMQGTFITETGDYRFLAGGFDGDSLKLSAFDGAHSFLFKAKLVNDTLRGKFWSGNHWSTVFQSWPNDSFELRDPYSLTSNITQDPYLNVTFENLEGQAVSTSDSAYLGKGVLVQVMGSWCPNCLDESAFLSTNYSRIKELGFDVIALAFEREEKDASVKVLRKLRDHLELPYEVLYAGKSSKKEAGEALPMLNGIMSYPTLIYLNSKHEIVKIHTGFYGPSTGTYHTEQQDEFWRILEGISRDDNL